MSKLYFTCLLWVAFSYTVTAQERAQLEGRVLGDNGPVNDVYVINNVTGQETKTDNGGNFTIEAKSGDKLAVYGNKTRVRQFVISETSFTEKPFLVSVEESAYELQEVVVEGQAVTSESLGLVPENQKQYTPAEKRMFTATSMPFDALINAISGRTKMLKKALETSRKAEMISTLNGLFTENEIAKFDIPKEYIDGFLFYIVEDAQFADAVQSNNEELMKFHMHSLAEKFIKEMELQETKPKDSEE
ncbi:hypothetical protein [Flavobacterium rhizosphaerae]|uniref:CarboxypepD_reg-like domain-containing protein n=1 Tax=Flavobacterium rhizosphaerae TaxID=3163298 RepID=A0ABW8YZF6_9FLAO